MKLTDLLSTQAIAIPWPILLSGQVFSGPALAESETCVRRCGTDRKCSDAGSLGENQCQYGMSYFRQLIGSEEVVIYGVRGKSNTTTLNKYTKVGLRGRTVALADVKIWADRISSLMEVIKNEFLSRQSEMLDPLHDPMRLAKQVNTIANRLVQIQSRGTSFEQQIETAPVELKTLVKASDLLSDSFDLLAIYFNPAAATYGRPSAISLHGLIMKLIAIFRIDDGGVTRTHAKIFQNGTCYRNVFVHESFKLVPFALLANAVKYAMQGNIDVVVEDRRQYVELSVASTGPFIEDSEREIIFAKRGRGRWASKYIDGKGVGLYLADLIAKAHGTSIFVTSNRTGAFQDEIPLARNVFTIHVPVSA